MSKKMKRKTFLNVILFYSYFDRKDLVKHNYTFQSNEYKLMIKHFNDCCYYVILGVDAI